jgi:hypothetical protein
VKGGAIPPAHRGNLILLAMTKASGARRFHVAGDALRDFLNSDPGRKGS